MLLRGSALEIIEQNKKPRVASPAAFCCYIAWLVQTLATVFPSCFADTSPQPIAVRAAIGVRRLAFTPEHQLPRTGSGGSGFLKLVFGCQRRTCSFLECCSSAALCAAWPSTYRFSCFGLEKCLLLSLLLSPCFCELFFLSLLHVSTSAHLGSFNMQA